MSARARQKRNLARERYAVLRDAELARRAAEFGVPLADVAFVGRLYPAWPPFTCARYCVVMAWLRAERAWLAANSEAAA